MKLCRCDMCETVAELEAPPSPYVVQQRETPKGWAHITISREHSVEKPMPRGQRMRFHSPEMGPVEASIEPTEMPKPEPFVLHVATSLDLCGKCLQKFATDPALSKRMVADEMRAEAMALRGGGMPG